MGGWNKRKHSSYLVVEPCMLALVSRRSSNKNLTILRYYCFQSVICKSGFLSADCQVTDLSCWDKTAHDLFLEKKRVS